MKKQVIVVHDPYDQSTWVQHETDDVRAFIKQQFPVWPQTGRIYHQQIAESNDITPNNPDKILALAVLDGLFYVLPAPAGGVLNSVLNFVNKIVGKVFSWFMPKVPSVGAQGSPNNDLADRVNKPRINGRIPDIFGKVTAIPDVISTFYSTYNATGQEVENGLVCVGRGYFQVHRCIDGDTDAQQITGMSVSVYDPHTSIVGPPIYQVGEAFTEPPLYIKKSGSINGQTLVTPNDYTLESGDIYFEYPNLIKLRVPGDFTTAFSINDRIAIYNARFSSGDLVLNGDIIIANGYSITLDRPDDISDLSNYTSVTVGGLLTTIHSEIVFLDGTFAISGIVKTTITGGFRYVVGLVDPVSVNPYWAKVDASYPVRADISLSKSIDALDLDGSYSIAAISASEIQLLNPDDINPDWSYLNQWPNASTQSLAATIRLDKLDSKWVGWYSVTVPEATGMLINLVFPQGLYWQSESGRQDPHPSKPMVAWQQLDSNGNPIGAISTRTEFIFDKKTSQFGLTLDVPLGFTGSFRFRLCNMQPEDGKARAELKVRDVYAYAPSDKLDYGNVTVARCQTIATPTALAVKERKLKLLVTRKLPANGTGALTATRSAADALIALAVDDKIGRMTLGDVDLDTIYQTVNDINTYFGTNSASEFCYTFDSDNQSFQESAAIVASTVFSEAERYGSVLTLRFEKQTANSSLLFNHRNKVPRSESRTDVYGIPNDYDGIELEYTDPADDSRIKFYIPSDQSAKNPQKITTYGVRNHRQAHFLAWRAWNKLLYQSENIKFDALRESDLVGRYERVLVADNTMPDTQDGEVVSQSGLILETSQACNFVPGKTYSIYLQLPDGSVDAIDITPGVDEYHVVLQRAPLKPLVLDYDRWVRTLYTIIAEGESLGTAFLLMEKSPSGRMVNSVELMNYDDRYYSNDKDFMNGLIS